MFDCQIRQNLLIGPVVLSCGTTVCKSHLTYHVINQAYNCKCCMQLHIVQNEGFVVSKFIQDQLNIQLNSIHINPIFDECKKN